MLSSCKGDWVEFKGSVKILCSFMTADISVLLHLSTQCAAVSTHWSAIRVPAQPPGKLPSTPSLKTTIQGHSPGWKGQDSSLCDVCQTCVTCVTSVTCVKLTVASAPPKILVPTLFTPHRHCFLVVFVGVVMPVGFLWCVNKLWYKIFCWLWWK